MKDWAAKAMFDAIQPRYPEFKNRVAVITGSARGIGRGIAIRLGREGMKVVIHGLDPGETAATHAELIDLDVEAIAISSDLRENQGIDQIFETTLTAFGTVDLLVNNAAELSRRPFFDVDEAMLDSQLAANIRAPYLCAQRAAEIMRKKGGNIINISSIGGIRSHWTGLPYNVSKGAIDAMTRAMSLDLAEFGIRVNAVAPGATQTERWPVKSGFVLDIPKRVPLERLGHPLDIAAAVAFLASSEASYITGQVVYVDGGVTSQLSPKGQNI